mmetsp:Transcript_7320/g.14914  ORF Transcript_7320/g.14914 Transcript_7320/m.14914 type:complete len:93 (+) Transcript_7320:629-907(+)
MRCVSKRIRVIFSLDNVHNAAPESISLLSALLRDKDGTHKCQFSLVGAYRPSTKESPPAVVQEIDGQPSSPPVSNNNDKSDRIGTLVTRTNL